MLLDIDKAASHLLIEHGALTIETRSSVAEPPLDVASWIRPGPKGVERPLCRDCKCRRADAETTIGLVDRTLYGGFGLIIEGASRGLQVKDQGLHVFPAALVGDRLKGTIFALDAGCPLVAQDARSVTLQSFDIGAQSLHHLHGLDVVNRIDSDGQLRYVKGAVISGSGDLSSVLLRVCRI